MPKFKAGDKVRHSNKQIAPFKIYEILFVGDDKYFYKVILLSGDPYENMCAHHSLDNSYVLYTEPQTVTRWINIYKSKGEVRIGEVVFKTKEQAIAFRSSDWIDCIEISYTEKES